MGLKIYASTGTKGGVGKSTFAVLLAFKLLEEGKKVVLCDCDIECPNDFLILGQKLQNPEKVYREFPELDKEECKKCGKCSRVCRANAIFWVKGKHPFFFYDLCSSCGACWLVCPFKAIKIKKEVVGEIFFNRISENFWLVTGKSKAGISETGPIVREVKKRAIQVAKEKNTDYLIVDTSPGTHCNVIQALLGVEKAYAVTEPTPLGAHDLSLTLELLQKLKILPEIVLNKCDIGNKEGIERIAKDFGVKISFEIPYSEELLRAYCEKDLKRMVSLI